MKRGFHIGPVHYTWRAILISTLLVVGAIALLSSGVLIYFLSGADLRRRTPPDLQHRAEAEALGRRYPKLGLRFDQPTVAAPWPAFGQTNLNRPLTLGH